MAASTSASASAARPSPWLALPALLALVALVGAVAWLWKATVPSFAEEPAASASAADSGRTLTPGEISAFANDGLQPGDDPAPDTGRDVPLYRSTEGTEFYRFRFERHGDTVTAGYRVRLGLGHQIYVLQEFDCATPRVKPLAAGSSILGLKFEPSPEFGPLDESHSDGRLRDLFCAMKS